MARHGSRETHLCQWSAHLSLRIFLRGCPTSSFSFVSVRAGACIADLLGILLGWEIATSLIDRPVAVARSDQSSPHDPLHSINLALSVFLSLSISLSGRSEGLDAIRLDVVPVSSHLSILPSFSVSFSRSSVISVQSASFFPSHSVRAHALREKQANRGFEVHLR